MEDTRARAIAAHEGSALTSVRARSGGRAVRSSCGAGVPSRSSEPRAVDRASDDDRCAGAIRRFHPNRMMTRAGSGRNNRHDRPTDASQEGPFDEHRRTTSSRDVARERRQPAARRRLRHLRDHRGPRERNDVQFALSRRGPRHEGYRSIDGVAKACRRQRRTPRCGWLTTTGAVGCPLLSSGPETPPGHADRAAGRLQHGAAPGLSPRRVPAA